MTRWKIIVEYDGAAYAGWQRQKMLPTVQEEIEKAIFKFCQQDIAVQGASRTDSGVHAYGQVAHFDLDYGDRPLSGFNLAKAINAHLIPQPISILKAEKVADDFHARFCVHQKLYVYKIIYRPSLLALDKKRAWHIKKTLNLDAMREAAKILVGRHDFTSFRATECQAKSPVRTIDSLYFTVQDIDNCGGLEIKMHIEGQAFLHHMVRNIIGTLVLVGEGKWEVDQVRQALESKQRAAAGPTAPPEGLYLVKIDY